MAKLEKLFKRSYETIRPVKPPTGQWSAIKDRLDGHVTKKGGKTSFLVSGAFLKTVLGLVVVGLAGASLFYALADSAKPSLKGNFSVVENTPQAKKTPLDEEAEKALFLPTEPRYFEVSKLETPPPQQKKSESITPASNEKGGRQKGRLIDLGATPFTATDPKNESPKTTQSTVVTTPKIAPIAPIETRSFPARTEQILASNYLLTIDSNYLAQIQKKLKWKFIPTPKKNKNAAFWELGAYFVPAIKKHTINSNVLREDAAPNTLSEYVLTNGEVISLGFANGVNADISPIYPLAISNLGVELAYQHSNGLRLGLWATWENRSRITTDFADRYIAQLAEDEYLNISNFSDQGIFAGLSAQYVFRRRKRLSFKLGFTAHTQVYGRLESGNFLLSGDGQTHLIRRMVSKNSRFIPYVEYNPQVGIQYQLNRKVGVSIELGIMIGIGFRYRL